MTPDSGVCDSPAMSASPDQVVVLGVTGGLGRAAARELASRGLPVRGVARHAPSDPDTGVRYVQADAESGDGLDEACAGAAVIVNALNPPYDQWPERFPPLNRAVIAAAERAGAKLLFVDNLYAYGPQPDPLTEDTPRAATSSKGRVRTGLEEELMAAADRGLRVTIGRVSDYFGPWGRSAISALVFDPALAGKAIRWPGSLDVPHTLHYLPDAARGLATLALDERADGRVWHLPALPAPTGREFAAVVNAALPAPVKVKRLSPGTMRVGALFSRDAREMLELAYQWTAPFVEDASRFEAVFGPIELTPLDEAVRATVAAAG